MRLHPIVAQLIDERRALDLTRKDVATAAEISRTTIDSLETGLRTPSLPSLEAYANALGFVITLVHVGEKYCRACETTKAIRYFKRDRRTPDGLASRCGPCAAANPQPRRLRDPDGRTAREQRQAAFAKGREQIAEEYAQRLNRFAALRRSGLSIAEAGRHEDVAVSYKTACRYDSALRKQQAEVAA